MSFEARISLKNHIIAAFIPSPTTPTAAKLHKCGHNAVIHHKGKAAHKDVSEKLYECIIGITRKKLFYLHFHVPFLIC